MNYLLTMQGCLCEGKSSGRPPLSEETVERVRETFTRSPRKSTTRASLELQMPQQTLWKNLRKRLRMIPCKLHVQLVQDLSCDDKRVLYSFCMSMQQWNGEDYDFFNRLIFGDESTFHLSGKVNKTTCVYGEQKNPRELVQYVQDYQKLTFFVLYPVQRCTGNFFF